MVTSSGRRGVRKTLREYPNSGLAFLLYTVTIGAFMAFGSITLLVAREGWIRFRHPPTDILTIWWFYIWHFFKSIPVLDFDAFKVNEPLPYDDLRIGFLLAAFKLILAVPVISAVAEWWKLRGISRDSGPGPSAATPATALQLHPSRDG